MSPDLSDTIFVVAVVVSTPLALLAAILLFWIRRRRSRAADRASGPALESVRESRTRRQEKPLANLISLDFGLAQHTRHRGAVRSSHVAEEPFYSPNARKPTSRWPNPGELLFGFIHADGEQMRCELRDHGEFGVEVQFLLEDVPYVARTFQGLPEFNVTARSLALTWAEHERQLMERRPTATEG